MADKPIPLMDYSSLPTMPENSPPRISLADMLMNQVTNPAPPTRNNEATVRALLADRWPSDMPLQTPLMEDRSMSPANMAMGLLGAPGLRGLGRGVGPMLAAETGGGAPKPASSQFVQMLNEALHKDAGAGFPAVFEQVKGLSASEIRAIAKEWNGVNTSSGAEALKKIWNRHQAMEVFRAKQRYKGSAG